MVWLVVILVLGLGLAPLVTEAQQQTQKVYHVGVLSLNARAASLPGRKGPRPYYPPPILARADHVVE